ncbi:cysteine--tRNA ligase [Erythrobacter litoralis]|uniref:cysteine--tRNA ligase n=1 Tax=Erythrobacter litoralis TaxID=39960 RepID=UPI0024352C9D|nr:cysteine--tRNA ligase [Erythrobacter litoralis]MDG6078582.1 cysteine--tRNA ligase [Erythrobacter litoralis]
MPDTPLKLFNSLTRQLETFEPVHAGEARVYTCGPTVYNYPHIGNMRAYVFADVLGRALSWKGYDLRHVINITDVGHLTDDADSGEDKLEKAAAGSDRTIWDIARHYTEAFKADIKALNIREPAEWSVATDYIEPMIEFAKGIADEHCYELDGGLYFDVSTVKDYGRLARAVTEDGEGRIDTVEGKRNQADFAIWRKTPQGETRQMEWDSPWGKGAPGWHLECSVMGEKLLGFPFDIHTGGIDHREIHHPNEIAQNQAFCGCGSLDEATHSGAKIWMHNNFLVERSGKMSKSSGEFLRLQLLIDKGYHPLAYRMMCLQAHYRSELEFSWEGLSAASRRLSRLVQNVRRIRPDSKFFALLRREYPENSPSQTGLNNRLLEILDHPIKRDLKQFEQAICDDLNTSEALTVLERVVKNKRYKKRHKSLAIALMDEVLGLGLIRLTRRKLRTKNIRNNAPISVVNADIDGVINARRLLKRAGEYQLSDELRRVLNDWGVEVMDGDPLGWEWKLG